MSKMLKISETHQQVKCPKCGQEWWEEIYKLVGYFGNKLICLKCGIPLVSDIRELI